MMALATNIVAVSDSLARSSAIERGLFGEGATLPAELIGAAEQVAQRAFIADAADYKIIVVLFIVLYLIWIGRSIANLAGTTFKISNPFASISEMTGLVKSVKMGDVMLDWVLVVALCTLFTTRVIDLTSPLHPDIGALVVHINNMGVWLWMALVSGIFLVMLGWNVVSVSVICFFMRRDSMMQELFTLKSRLLKMSVIWILPFALLSSLEHINLTISYLAGLVVVAFVVIYLFRSYLLFARQKISILHWILYLCTVEILPITLLWAFFVR